LTPVSKAIAATPPALLPAQGVRARIAELQGEVAKESELTVQTLVDELEAARQQASNLKQLSAAVRTIEAKAKVSGLLVQRMEIGGVGDFNGYNQDDPADIVRWLTDKSIEECVSNQPELAPYVHFSDDNRAVILGLFEQINSLIEQRREEAKTARYNDLIANYHPRPPSLPRQNQLALHRCHHTQHLTAKTRL
jgi:hypothetical protein